MGIFTTFTNACIILYNSGTCTKERENDTITDERFCPDMYSHEYVLPIQETSQPLRCSLVHGRLPMLGRLGECHGIIVSTCSN